MSPEIAVVVPCFNAERYVGAMLRSVLQQDEMSLEVVVVDDGSTDDSGPLVADMARSDSRIRLMRQGNSGVSGARNAGFSVIDPSCQFVLFLDSDDVLEPNALRTLMKALETAPDACAAAGTCFRIDDDGSRPHERSLKRSFDTYTVTDDGVTHRARVDQLDYWDVLPANPILTGACLVRRAALPVNPFDASLRGYEDWKVWLRLARSGMIRTVHEPVLAYRDTPSSASKNYDVMWDAKRQVITAELERASAASRARFEHAYYFALYRYSELLNWNWARAAFSERRLIDSARYAQRGLRTRLREILARRRDAFKSALDGR